MDGKHWYTSKAIWVNAVAVGAAIAQAKYGYVVSPETQGIILGVINVVLRYYTEQPIKKRRKK